VKTTSVWASLFFLVACGGAPGSTLDVERASGPQFRLEGDCGPSARSTALPVRLINTQCLVSPQPPTLLETAEDLRRLVSPGCTEGLEIDFTTSKVLVVCGARHSTAGRAAARHTGGARPRRAAARAALVSQRLHRELRPGPAVN
jgi:hypothetical protein